MKPETKLLIRKRVLMTLRAIVWHVDEWLHRQEVKLRQEISTRQTATENKGAERESARTVPIRPRENFLQWEARKSGIAVVSKKEARQRRRVSAADFDRRFAS